MENIRYSCEIFMNLGFCGQIFLGILKYQISLKSVQWEPICTTRTDGRTDRHEKTISRFSQFFESTPEPITSF